MGPPSKSPPDSGSGAPLSDAEIEASTALNEAVGQGPALRQLLSAEARKGCQDALLVGPGAGAIFFGPASGERQTKTVVVGNPVGREFAPPQQPRRGIALMLAATLSFVAMGACVKMLREHGMSTTEVMFWRSAPGAGILFGVLLWRGISLVPSDWVGVAARCLFGIFAMAGNFFAVGYLTLAQHGTLHLTQPIFVAAISPALLAERASRHTLAALALAGCGAAIVLIPGLDLSRLPVAAALAGLMGALMAALAAISIRRATRRDSPDLIVFHFALATGLVCLIVGVARGELCALWQSPNDPLLLGGVVGVAGLGLLGQMFLSRAYGAAKALVVAIIGYVAIPLNFFMDALLWDSPPTLQSLAGAILVIGASGLLLRDATAPTPAAPPPRAARASSSPA